MPTKQELQQYIAKGTKCGIVLNALLKREYVTGQDIIDLTRTNCPHGIIRDLRKRFGVEFILDCNVPFVRIQYNSKGKPFTISDEYKRYFLNKMVGIS